MKSKKYEIKIVVNTGLHIGGTEQYEIGGIDNVVIKTPDGMPYIPGSSLKGKLRYLHRSENEIRQSSPDENPEEQKIFGTGKVKGDENNAMESSVIFRDIYIDEEETRKEFKKRYNDGTGYIYDNAKENKFVEIKTENTQKGRQNLRFSERIVPGVVFKGNIIFRDINGMDIEELKSKIDELTNKLSEFDYLGGSGTRGYGQVSISIYEKNTNSDSE